MKQEFSKSWQASKQPRKQRKFLANAPLHLKRKLLSVNLSKDLRKKHSQRNIPIKKGDVAKVMRGKYKKKQGKVTDINTKLAKIYLEGIQAKKRDGSKVNVALRPSNLQIIELNLEDKKRLKKSVQETKKEEKVSEVKEEKKTKKEDSKELKTKAKKK